MTKEHNCKHDKYYKVYVVLHNCLKALDGKDLTLSVAVCPICKERERILKLCEKERVTLWQVYVTAEARIRADSIMAIEKAIKEGGKLKWK